MRIIEQRRVVLDWLGVNVIPKTDSFWTDVEQSKKIDELLAGLHVIDNNILNKAAIAGTEAVAHTPGIILSAQQQMALADVIANTLMRWLA
jgi:hypothetical protein